MWPHSSPLPTSFLSTHILKQCTLSSSCQKTTNEKGGLFIKKEKRKRKKVAVALIPYRLSVLNCTGTLACKYLLIPVLSKAEQTFHSSVKHLTHQVREWGSPHKQHHKPINKIRHRILPILTYLFVIYSQNSYILWWILLLLRLRCLSKWSGLLTKRVPCSSLIQR